MWVLVGGPKPTKVASLILEATEDDRKGILDLTS
jgi:hypothetical protein